MVFCSTAETADALVEGFTIREGSASDADHGGAIVILDGSNPTIRNCVFQGNTAIRGGAIYIRGSSPTLEHCTFVINTSGFGIGGAIANVDGSQPSITNCEFIANNAFAGRGGAIANVNSSPTITNGSFHGNTASLGGAAIYSLDSFSNPRAEPVLRNSVVWGNFPDGIVEEGGATTTVVHSTVEGGWSGAGGLNISTNPRFALESPANRLLTDLRLRLGSPAIDSGDNTLLPASVDLDLAGARRFVDDPGSMDLGNGAAPIVDMGAFEFQPFDTLVFGSDGQTLSWVPIDGAGSYQLYRGDLADLTDEDDDGRPDGGYGACHSLVETGSAELVDPEIPIPGNGFFYLLAAVDDDGDSHGLGVDSSGMHRIPNTGC